MSHSLNKNIEYTSMMKSSHAALLVLLLVGCSKGKIDDNEKLTPDVKTETEKWKHQLLVNGEVGTPYEEDYINWIAKNPECYYGLPTQINAKVFDVNKDGKTDLLLYFPSGESCTGGHEEGSDFIKLIYSNGNDYLENDNLRNKIASKIEVEFYNQTNTDVKRAIFSITGFSTVISGTFKLWSLEDPDCCPGYEGIFHYNPFTWKIRIKRQKSQQIN